MFGHQDNQPTEQNDQAATASIAGGSTTPAPVDQSPVNQPSMPADPSTSAPAPSGQPAPNGQPWQHPGRALDDTQDQKGDVISPAGGYPKPLSNKENPIGPTSSLDSLTRLDNEADDNQLTDATDESLVEVKQKALDELFPLIDKLDQTSEEHFKTLMMIIQASDNHTLIEKAYQVAQTIDDEKARAQALLDIVNEINYFTQQPEI
jgi:hypothetical protein